MSRVRLTRLLIVTTVLLASQLATPLAAQPPATDAFLRVWIRTDQPVADHLVNRTWMWGPHAASMLLTEPYAESPGGERLVQYFDKSRMEVTQPGADPSSDWYVTNGLLVVELVSGRQQVGDDTFIEVAPATIPVAGDAVAPDSPTYATMALVLDAPPLADGEVVTTMLHRDGTTTTSPEYSDDTVYAAYPVRVPGIDQQVASVFWTFMTSSGVVSEGDTPTNAPLFPNPFYATGYPITQPYWAEVKVGGEVRVVLIQCFERRCLTYDRSQPEGWQVEAGNVGRHSYQWRYGTPLPTAPDPPPSGRILFRNDVAGEPDVFAVDPDGTDVVNLTDTPGWDIDAVWSPDGTQIAFASERDGDPDVYVMQADGSGVRNLTNNTAIWDSSPIWSPDGTQLLFQTDRDGNNIGDELFLMNADGSNQRLVDPRASTAQWSPDGTLIAFMTTGVEATDIVVMHPDGTGRTTLTRVSQYASWLRWSPDGTLLAFQQQVDGNTDIYTIRVVDGALTRLTDDPALDLQPDWSPDGQSIAFESERDNAPDVWVMRADGSHEANLTHDRAGDWCRPCSWSPGSRYIAFQSNRGLASIGGDDIYLVSVHTREMWQVTMMTMASTPEWSP